MPLPISTAAILEKNKITSDNVWLLLLEITYPGETPVRVCLNNETITWDSETWFPAAFSLSGLQETKDAEIPSVTLEVLDLARVITPHLETYDGGVGADVIIRVVNSKYLANTTPELEETMEIIGCSIDHQNKISFKLGAENLLARRCPENRYLKNHCRFKFKDTATCQYAGAETTCNLSLANCKALGNQLHYGGFPGVGNIGFVA